MESSVQELVRQVAETIQKEASVRAVFGEPIKLDQHTIVPVAIVHIAFGGGGAGTSGVKSEVVGKMLGFGGGGGLDVSSVPLGFITEKDGDVVFRSIALADGDAATKEAHGTIERILAALKRK